MPTVPKKPNTRGAARSKKIDWATATIPQAAQHYLNLGLRVVPCPPGMNKSFRPGWHQENLADWQVMRAISNGGNIGMAVHRSDYIVVDADAPEKIETFVKMCGGKVPRTPTKRTPRGFHWMFKRPANIHPAIISSNYVIDGVEFGGLSTETGKLSMLPPSVRTDEKYQALTIEERTYRWEPGLAFGEVAVAELPAAVLELLRRKPPPSPGGGGGGRSPPTAAAKCDGANRNSTLFKLACRIGGKLTPEALLATVQAENLKRYDPPLKKKEVEGLVKSSLNYVAKDATKNGKPPPSAMEADSSGPERIDAMDLMNEESSAEVETLPLLGQPGFVLKGMSNLLSAFPKTGKTELTYNLVAEWLKAGETVLYFTEESRLIWKHRLDAPRLIDRHGLQLIFAHGTPVEDLLEIARQSTETVVVIDTLRGLHVLPETENDPGVVQRALDPWVGVVCREQGRTLLGVTHDRKAEGTFGRGVSGAAALVGAADMILELKRVRNDCRRKVIALGRLVQPEPLTYERQEDGTMTVVESGGEADPPKTKKPALIEFLPTEPPGIPIEEIINLAKVAKQAALVTLGLNKSVVKTGSGKRGDPKLYYRVR